MYVETLYELLKYHVDISHYHFVHIGRCTLLLLLWTIQRIMKTHHRAGHSGTCLSQLWEGFGRRLAKFKARLTQKLKQKQKQKTIEKTLGSLRASSHLDIPGPHFLRVSLNY